MIEVLAPGPLTTVQDLGRRGMRRYGVGCSGAMDSLSAAIANVLAGNEADAALLELSMPPVKLRFSVDTVIALTGGDFGARLDERPVAPWWRIPVRAGQTLHLQEPRSGARVYMAVGGGIDVPLVMGSRSTHLRGQFGGFEGRSLRKGDRIAIRQAGENDALLQARGFGVRSPFPRLGLPSAKHAPVLVRFMGGAEHVSFANDSVHSFEAASWRITPQSNRLGFRLQGDVPLKTTSKGDLRSYGVLPGLIQVPPDGQPIIQMADANVTGGYARFGSVITADLWRVAQAPIGASIRFQHVDRHQAVEALRELIQVTAALEASIRRALNRSQPASVPFSSAPQSPKTLP